MHIYLVDDDPLARRMARRMLIGTDAECIEFDSGASFLDRLEALETGCVLLDIDMPGRNGLEVLHEVAMRKAWPVVIVSGSNRVDDAIRAFRQGAVHFLRKPFRRADLVQTLGEAVAREAERQRAVAKQAEAARIRLSKRETEVLHAMSAGHQTKAIAWALGLSLRTVEMHRSNLMKKMKARNSTQAISIARTYALIPDSPAGTV
ncbi:response regulator transcription factor [Sphingomonas spermidinifaciens]|nr:response regulator [Sphingomonas spermidinifaciens]